MRDKIANIAFIVILIIFVFIGGLAGYSLGDMILEASEYTRPSDILTCRVGLPALGAFLFAFIGVLFGSWVGGNIKYK